MRSQIIMGSSKKVTAVGAKPKPARWHTPRDPSGKSMWLWLLSQEIPKDETEGVSHEDITIPYSFGQAETMEFCLFELRVAAALLEMEGKCALLTVWSYFLSSPLDSSFPHSLSFFKEKDD